MISLKDWIRIQNYLKVEVNVRKMEIVQYTRLLLVEDLPAEINIQRTQRKASHISEKQCLLSWDLHMVITQI